MIEQYILITLKRIEALKKSEAKHDGHDTDSTGWCYECLEMIKDKDYSNNKPYNQAIDTVLGLLRGDLVEQK